MTLIELMLALMIVAIVSVAAERLLAASLRTDTYLQQQNTALSELEMTVRRLTHNLRTCQSLTSPAGTTAQNSVTLVTQPDTSNGSTSYTVTYALVGTTLQETDTRYGTNTLVNNVSAFSVTRQTVASPVVLTITITISVKPQITRTFQVYCRNI